MVFAVLGFVVTLFLKSKPLKSAAEYHNGGPARPEKAAAKAIVAVVDGDTPAVNGGTLPIQRDAPRT